MSSTVTKVTRRDFLKRVGLVTGSTILALSPLANMATSANITQYCDEINHCSQYHIPSVRSLDFDSHQFSMRTWINK